MSAVLNVTFDCADAAGMARFWSAATESSCELYEMPGNPFWMVAGTPQLVFVQVDEPKTIKNRVHLDLVPGGRSQAEEVARLQALGARIADDRRDATPGGWVVMTDPEGNEFCVEPSDS